MNIRGKYNCICFSETPISAINQIIAQKNEDFRYGPFGFIFSKKYLFDLGARPAIYQPNEDFDLLPDQIKYRHVRYEIDKHDYTWEREWRLRSESLTLEPEHVTLIVKDRVKIEEIKKKALGGISTLALATRGYFSSRKLEWHFIALSDLG